MRKKLQLLSIFFLFATNAFTQSSFQYTPQNPKAGEVISFTYEPAGAIAGTLKPVEAVYYMLEYAPAGAKTISADDIPLTKSGKKYTGTVKTDTAANFIYFGFLSDNKFDNNFNEGYYIVLNDGAGNPRKGAYNALSMYYQYFGSQVGVDRNNEKALEYLEKEMGLNADLRKNYLPAFLRLLSSDKKTEAPAIMQKEIEGFIKRGLKTEEDYQTLENLYTAAKLPEQAKMAAQVKKEKFPGGKWVINETVQKLYTEQDPAKAEAMSNEILKKIKTDSNWKHLEVSTDWYKLQPLYVYQRKKDWGGLKRAAAGIQLKDPSELASVYNEAAWEMQKTSTDLKAAEEMSRTATAITKKEITNPIGKKPSYMTTKQWEKNRKSTYAMFADTYAMVLYRQGQYKKGLPYAKEAALTINKGKDPDQNNTYALLAEKSLPAKQYKKELEKFVKDGKSTSEIKEVLKRAYVKQKSSEEGFSDYITMLEKESYTKMIEELRKSMLNTAAPSFALLDLDGNKVDISTLKGKTVVVDFWATWCGPCKASFPGMQKIVTKFKDDPNVKFVFIDTWEQGEDKKKKVADFITSNKYTFHVLMDDDSKVVEQFKVEGIPTKFVIDKNGIIRFKSVGFDGSDDKLVSELTAMIEMATESKKVF